MENSEIYVEILLYTLFFCMKEMTDPDGHSGLLTFGVLIFGVGGSGFRMFGVSDVGGSVFFSDIRGFWCF